MFYVFHSYADGICCDCDCAGAAAASGSGEGDAAAASGAGGGSLQDFYARTMRDLVLNRVNLDEDGKGYATHKFRGEIAAGMSQNSRNCLARVNKELRSMKASLPVDFTSSIVVSGRGRSFANRRVIHLGLGI